MYRLPASGLLVNVRAPGGAEDIMLWDAVECDRVLALALISRVTSVAEPANLLVHDFEALLLHLHSQVFGDTIQADAVCSCRRRIDITFRTSAFLRSRTPRRPRGVAPDAEPGWFTLSGDGLSFRLPTVGDQIAVAAEPDQVAALIARCVRPPAASARVQRAMAALAPPLSSEVAGTCPYCRARASFAFDVPSFVLKELQVQSSAICDDVHQLAHHYHWSEQHILALPPRRRRRYVEMVTAERGVG